ncbi:MAG: DMT family transporter [Thermodesulfobacteriota bacterium]
MKNIVSNPKFLMTLYSILVAGSFSVGHRITIYMDSDLLIFIRFFLATIVFGIYTGFKYRLTLPSIKDFIRYFTISITLVIYFTGMFEALKYTTPLNTGIIYTLVPLFSAVFGFFILREKTGFKKIIVLLLAMAGALWVISDGNINKLAGLKFGKGDLIFLFACISMGFFSPLSKKFKGNEKTPVLTFWTLATGTIILFFITNRKIFEYNWDKFPFELGAGLFYLVVFTTMLTFFIVQYSSVRMDVGKVMSYIYLIPVFVLVIEFFSGKGLPPVTVLPGIIIAGLCTFLFQRN